jgi:hypothetical protein
VALISKNSPSSRQLGSRRPSGVKKPRRNRQLLALLLRFLLLKRACALAVLCSAQACSYVSPHRADGISGWWATGQGTNDCVLELKVVWCVRRFDPSRCFFFLYCFFK